MIRTTQGAQVTLTGTFRLTSGELVDPVGPTVDIFDPAGNYVVQNHVPTREAVGEYYYVYTVPPLAPVGTWSIRWTGTINGAVVSSGEAFEVLTAGSLDTTVAGVARIRILTGEVIPPGGTDANTRFSDVDLTDIYSRHATLSGAVLEVWQAKAAYFAQYIDIEESGSNRKFSQLYKNANEQVALWQKRVEDEDDIVADTVAATRVVGSPVRWAQPADEGIAAPRVMYGSGGRVRG